MPRSRRQDYEGAWQHAMNRGIDRNSVFRSDDDRYIFCDCLAVAMPRYGVQVHAYCLLGNHFHLLLFSETGRLSDAMRFLAGRFTQRINYRDGRDGPLFRGRSPPWQSRATRISCGPAATSTATRWSSASAYIGHARPPTWLRTEAILEMFGPQRPKQEYQDFLRTETDEATRESYANWGQTLRV